MAAFPLGAGPVVDSGSAVLAIPARCGGPPGAGDQPLADATCASWLWPFYRWISGLAEG